MASIIDIEKRRSIKAFVCFAFLLLSLFPSVAVASVFGDSDPSNGFEDQRLARAEAGEWPDEFRAVGGLYCKGRLQGTAVVIKTDFLESSAPYVLTALHVIDDFDAGKDCAFAPESRSWERYRIVSVAAKGDALGSDSMASTYAEDWALLELEGWRNWDRFAVDLSAQIEPLEPGAASLVGFDIVRNRVVAHFNCDYGAANQSSLTRGNPALYWDNCDTSQGSSGGAMFVARDGGYSLVGIRTGSLFDRQVYGGVPEMGAEFDLDTNVNVTRVISAELFVPTSLGSNKHSSEENGGTIESGAEL